MTKTDVINVIENANEIENISSDIKSHGEMIGYAQSNINELESLDTTDYAEYDVFGIECILISSETATKIKELIIAERKDTIECWYDDIRFMKKNLQKLI